MQAVTMHRRLDARMLRSSLTPDGRCRHCLFCQPRYGESHASILTSKDDGRTSRLPCLDSVWSALPSSRWRAPASVSAPNVQVMDGLTIPGGHSLITPPAPACRSGDLHEDDQKKYFSEQRLNPAGITSGWFRHQKLMCHLNLDNPMDVQERHITNRKCRDSGVQGSSIYLLREMTVGVWREVLASLNKPPSAYFDWRGWFRTGLPFSGGTLL
ncbi:hypothetical protein J6590_029290 [Homalodisca vitripennis]|nr:hypothetical protein J6590_029290 [Homalodisca vitripennis]